MMHHLRKSLIVVVALALLAGGAVADETAEKIRAVTEKMSKSLVTVSFYVKRDDGVRVDARVQGCVVGAGNLVMITSRAISDAVPMEQYHDFEAIVPRGDQIDTYEAEYLGKDNTAQVAFLRITDASAPQLPAVQFDETVQLQPGDPIISYASLGEPDAYKRIVQTVRVAAVLDRPYRMQMVDGNLGVLGTPVVTLDGQVVGIVGIHVLDRGKGAGQNRMAPIKVVWPTERFIERLNNPPTGGKRVKRPWLGVGEINPLSKDMAEFYNLGEQRGVIIGRIIEGTPADTAGLKAADIILALDGKAITGAEGQLVPTFQNMLKQLKIGQEITLDVFRDAKVQKIKVTLAEQPKTPAEAERYRNKKFGMTVREMVLVDTIVRELPRAEPGVVVDFVEPSGWAQVGDLQTGDVVKKVQGRDVADLDAFKTVFEEEVAKKPKEIVLFVLRGKAETKVLRIEPRWDGEEKPANGDAGK
jgi:serine protease Do